MFRTLVKAEAVTVYNQHLTIRYFEILTGRGLKRYSVEILIAPGDRIILDDDSIVKLEARAARVVPATVYSRMLAQTA